VIVADIECCKKMVCIDPAYAYCFAKYIENSDLDLCLQSVSGSEWESALKELIIESAIC